jgi:hypothetical protein
MSESEKSKRLALIKWRVYKRRAAKETLTKRQRENDYVDARLPKQCDNRQAYK